MADKELQTKLKVLSFFNQDWQKLKRTLPYFGRIFVHDDIMYATDGHIFCCTKNISDKRAFSFYKGRELKYLGEDEKEVKELVEKLEGGTKLERIIENFNYFDLHFDIDLSDFPLPVKLQASWSRRYDGERVTIDVENKELIFDFDGGMYEDGGVTATYSEVITGVEGKEIKIRLASWYILKVMQLTKTKKLHFDVFTERNHITCTAGDYTFLMIAQE